MILSVTNRQYSTATITGVANQPTIIYFTNNDDVNHNVTVYRNASKDLELFRGELFVGPDVTVIYEVPPLAAGEYYVAFLLNDGYEDAAPRVPFAVRKRGDINGDGRIDVADRDVQRAAIGSCDGDARYQPLADFDSDRCITQADYKLWYALFTKQ